MSNPTTDPPARDVWAREMIREHGLKNPAASVLYALATRARPDRNHHHTCFPGIETLAGDAGCSVNTATKGVETLRDVAGVIEARRRWRRSTLYRLLIPKDWEPTPAVDSQNRESGFTENAEWIPKDCEREPQRPNPKEEPQRKTSLPSASSGTTGEAPAVGEGVSQSLRSGSGGETDAAKREQFDKALSEFPVETINAIGAEAWIVYRDGDGKREPPQQDWSVPALAKRLRGWANARRLPVDRVTGKAALDVVKARIRAGAYDSTTSETGT